ncbi:MAG: ABC transporter substrate binding protein, partial [Xanthobacteraceae bacterium]
MAAAKSLGIKLQVLNASKEDDFEATFAELVRLHAGGLVISNDTFYVTRQELLAVAAIRHAMPAISQSREFVTAGGLMSYSGSYTETHKQAGVYTGRILKGE